MSSSNNIQLNFPLAIKNNYALDESAIGPFELIIEYIFRIKFNTRKFFVEIVPLAMLKFNVNIYYQFLELYLCWLGYKS